MKRKFLFYILSLIGLYSCHPLVCFWSFGYEQIIELNPEDIVHGNYELTKESLNFIQSEDYKGTCQLQLFENGTFVLTDAPDFMFNDFGENKGQILDKTGKWHVSSYPQSHHLIELENIFVRALCRKDEGPIAIPIEIGDGDFCEGIVFVRSK